MRSAPKKTAAAKEKAQAAGLARNKKGVREAGMKSKVIIKISYSSKVFSFPL